MIQKLQELKRKIKAFDLKKALDEINSKPSSKTTIESTIRTRLDKQGTTSTNIKLRTNRSIIQGTQAYSIRTEKIKGSLNHVNLRDTSEFYASIESKAQNGNIIISADFDKENGKIGDNFSTLYPDNEKFENEVIGLSDEELRNYIENIILPQLGKIVKNNIGV